MAVLVPVQAVGGQRPVAFQQAGQDVLIEAVRPGPARLAGALTGLDQGRRPAGQRAPAEDAIAGAQPCSRGSKSWMSLRSRSR